MIGDRSFFEVHPDTIIEWSQDNGPLPIDERQTSKRRASWKCSGCGHRWSATFNARHETLRRETPERGCPECFRVHQAARHRRPRAGHSVADGPIAAEWSERNLRHPADVAEASNDRYWWRCVGCDHEWSTPPSDRRKGHGCPRCAFGRLRIAIADTRLIAEWSDKNTADPRFVAFKSHQKFWWTCKPCGFEWEAKASHRSNGRGCPRCARRGFNPGRPGVLYVMGHSEFRHWQFGITNVPTVRVEQHRRHGWYVTELVDYSIGAEAADAERMIKAWMKRESIVSQLTRREVPEGGWTECVPMVVVPDFSARRLLAGAR